MNNEIDRNCRNYLDSSVRWTDKVTLCANGDIVEDFSGKIVGHITPDVYKEITKNETMAISFNDGDVTTYKRFKEADNEQ